ncbi:MAG: UDP-N-acetylmuramate--L-alanine ligase [Deltaproteobacteria bacterium]|nr:UDP-N-acetylmuramate--L-alanine ligase [Deltaproteobacteria bacterium]|tara:strand:- start:3125 stop:4519 length:1395 start_codon:yes stop_codon:yes gene_type:complete
MYQKRIQHIHFVGIGGIGMSGIAEVLINLGYEVSGSDLNEGQNTKHLRELGATIHIGHSVANLAQADVVVISSAIRGGNPEVDAAKRRKIPVIRRAEMLAELMRMKYGIAVAGTHGKTTTTSLIASILEKARIDPTVVIGGRLNATGRNAILGKGEFLVAEADESDGSFLRLSPTIGIVTNIDPEHLDFFGGMDEVRQSYLDFLNKIPFYGVNIICLDHEEVQALIPKLEKRYVTYGLNTQADLQANAITYGAGETSFEMIYKGDSLGRFTLHMLGQHNVLNCLAACAVAFELDVEVEVIREALQEFSGIQRRFQIWCNEKDVMVVDDYAHHPAEIKATLAGANSAFDRRVIALFQPHRYSRLNELFQEFVTSFYQVDVLCVSDVYAAGEQPIEGINGETVCEAIINHGHHNCRYFDSHEKIYQTLVEEVRPGDLVITLGAGDIWKIARDLTEFIQSDAFPAAE